MLQRSRPPKGAVVFVAAAMLAGCGSGTTATAQPSAPAPTRSVPAAASPTAGSTAACSPGSIGPAYELASCQIDSPALANNLLGDPAFLSAYILTPIDYETSGIRYPTVYMLTGYTDPATGAAFSLASSEPSQATPAGKVRPIVVVVSGANVFGGGMYANSSVSGNWEDAIVNDLVGYVDGHYRTIAKPASRGLAGHSMGGAGSVNIAMRHPEVFGALYALSPAIFDQAEAQNILGDALASRMLDIEDQLAEMAPADRISKLETAVTADGNVTFTFAYGTAYAPDPASPILMQFPYRRVNGQIVRDDAVWARWDAGWGGLEQKVQQYKANLRQYRAIGVDYGTNDEIAFIPPGSHYFVTLLEAAGVPVSEYTFAGGHTDQVNDRILNHMLPFMAQNLLDS